MKMLKKMRRGFVSEFKFRSCGLTHLPSEDFVRSQWQSRTKNIIFLIYRWLLAALFIAATTTSMWPNETAQDWGLYFIYLTHWGILLCLITTIMGAVLVTIWFLHPNYADKVSDSNEMPVHFKIYWALHNTSLILSIIITLVYWSILFKEDTIVDAANILTHATNSIFMFLDVLIVAYPIRLLHVVQPVAFGLVYLVFSLIFYLAGGVDRNGNRYVYNVLDWSQPDKALITAAGTLVLIIVLHTFMFCVYKLRTLVYRRCCGKSTTFLPTATPSTQSPTISVIGSGYHSATPPTGRISMVLSNYGHDNRAFIGTTDKVAS